MAFKLRTAQPGDADRLVELHRFSYPLSEHNLEERRDIFERNPRCDLEDVFVVNDGDDLIACMIAYRFNQYQEEAEIPIVGIGTVSVAPDRRREGVAGFMIEGALELFEEQGVPACILYPFEHRFYRYLGWGYAGEIRHYQMLTSQIADYEDAIEDEDLSVELFQEEQLPQLMAFYDAQARHFNGLLQRVESYWKECITDSPRQVVLARFSGEIIGYMIYSLEKIYSGNTFAQRMVVHEWMAPTLDARDALLNFMARQSDQVESLQLSLQPDEPLHLWVDDPRSQNRRMMQRLYSETATVGLGWMYRLVNLKGAFESGRRFNNVKGELAFVMEDELLGDRRLMVSFSGGGAVAAEASSRPKRLVRGPVDVLSQMFCGYTTAQQAYEQDLLDFEGRDTVEFCQRAFWLPPPRCFDLF